MDFESSSDSRTMSSSRAKGRYDRRNIPILLKAQGVRNNCSLTF